MPVVYQPKSILKKKGSMSSSREDKQFRFNETVLVGETFGSDEYVRKGDLKIHMTPTMAYLIRQELNDFKRIMPIHENSRKYTHYYK